MIFLRHGERHYMSIVNQNTVKITNWWPVSDEEWERLNYPEKFNHPTKDPKPVDKDKQ